MNKQELIEELRRYMATGYSEERNDNNEAKRPPKPEKCDLCDSLKDIIESISECEEGIGKLLEAEAEKLKCTVKCPDELVRTNKSISDLLDNLIILEGFTILKLKVACTCEDHENPVSY